MPQAGVSLASARAEKPSESAHSASSTSSASPQARRIRLEWSSFASQQEFLAYVVAATSNLNGPEHEELRRHLSDCFARTCSTMGTGISGFADATEFDAIVEAASDVPRRFGLMPTAAWQFTSVDERMESRAALFQSIDVPGRGMISQEDFVNWAMDHIHTKAGRGASLSTAGVGRLSLLHASSAEELIHIMKEAMTGNKSPAYADLYFHLLRCFTDADVNRTGLLHEECFDGLIERASQLPRKFGVAPSAESLYANDTERKRARGALFKSLDKNGDRYITFDDFLVWTTEHIKQVSAKASVKYTVGWKNKAGGDLPVWDEADTAEEFAQFCAAATTSKQSKEFQKLYFHLLRCFSDADITKTGCIGVEQFDGLIDRAASAPRKFGFAPSNSDVFLSEEDRKLYRSRLFREINQDRSGLISFREFLKWAMDHIRAKVTHGAAPWKAGVGRLSLIETSSTEDFVQFLKDATASTRSPAYRGLYFHLLRCFTDADTTKSGVIDFEGFDGLIDKAAQAPRKYGFAPSTDQLYRTEVERKQARAALFKTIDKYGSGTIGFDDFLDWATTHIRAKVSVGVQVLYRAMAPEQCSAIESKNLPIYDEATSDAEFARFCSKATIDKNGAEYQKLYYHLLRCFSDADMSLTGRINAEEFDGLVEIAAAAPRKFGFAPPTSSMFASVEERRLARVRLFRTINADGTGEISFQEFLRWALAHIKEFSRVSVWLHTGVVLK